jgi:hypothetical protein
MGDLKLLRIIIETLLKVDVTKKSRTRNVVDARYIYTKILRDRGHTCTAIAREIGKDHTTVVHYTNKMSDLLSREVLLAEKYILCKMELQKENPVAEEDLSDRIISLKEDNERLILERKKFNSMYEKYIRLSDIIRLIDQRTPKGSETMVYDKINKMFNGYQTKDLTNYERVKKMGGG